MAPQKQPPRVPAISQDDQTVFYELLTHQAPPGRAERGSDRQFLDAGRASSHRKIRQVAAGDEQHQADDEHEERADR